MDITITPGRLHGEICAIPSKSHAHRILICAALADKPTDIVCSQTNSDIDATVQCLNSIGAKITRTDYGFRVLPIRNLRSGVNLDCGESASTLRFLLPVIGALGIEANFIMCGGLSLRPLSPLWSEMEQHGCTLRRPSENVIQCTGRLLPGEYVVDGTISSQFISGLLLAMTLMDGDCQLIVSGQAVSKPYIKLTQEVLHLFGVDSENYSISVHQRLLTPGQVCIDGDWSNAAFFCVAQYFGCPINISGLNPYSQQGDKAIVELLRRMHSARIVDIADTPDLFPILAVAAGATSGAEFINISRLRYKESDRIESVANMLKELGAKIEITDNTMTVEPAVYRGCCIDSKNDHRIAMAAAIAAIIATGPVTIRNAECVKKSYPSFWDDYRKLGGNYEQHV